MTKTEIKEFFISCENIKELRALVPFSVGALIRGEAADKFDGEVVFCAYIDSETALSAGESAYLRLYTLPLGTRVSFNGQEIENELKANKEVLTLDVTSLVREGVNTLEVRYGGELLDAGVLKNAEFIRTSYPIIDGVSLNQVHEDGKVTLGIRLDTLGTSDNVRAVATLVSGAGQIYYGGIMRGRGTITVPDPLYWWPRGLGVQNLYKLTINVYGDMEIEDTFEARVGFRTLTTAGSADGTLLEVNGVSFLPMGAVYDTPKKRYTEDAGIELESSMIAAARAGVNTLVIPCDCDMPCDRFFELCDLYGMVAVRECTDIRADYDALFRRSTHASVGIVDFIGVGDNILAVSDKLREINQDLELSAEDKAAEHYSVKSLACVKTVRERIAKKDRNILSEAVAGKDDGEIIKLIGTAATKHLYAENIYDFAYVSQLVEAELVEREMMERRIARRARGRAVFSSIGKKSGVISDGLIDVNYRTKAVAYRAARFFSPTAAYAKAEGSVVEFYVSNESRSNFVGVIEYRILDSANNLIHKNEESCIVNSSSSKFLFTRDFSEYIAGRECECVLEYSLHSGSNLVYRSSMIFVEPKKFKFLDPFIESEISGADKKYSLTLTSHAFAMGVEIDFENTDVVINDNYINITQNMPIKISFTVIGETTTAEKLKSELCIKSVYDIGNGTK
ncbi:MAG: hypothetical protein IJW03_01450 [Clostridia bacterium]|nr:hypothetical protein [Clostridia bacterium]